MFYDNFIKLCDRFGASPSRVLLDIGMSKSTLTNWKAGGAPFNETKKKIAEYFNVWFNAESEQPCDIERCRV